MTNGGVSSSLKAKYECFPLDGLRKRIVKKSEILFTPGYEIFNTDWNRKYVEPDTTKLKALHNEAVNVACEADIVLYFG